MRQKDASEVKGKINDYVCCRKESYTTKRQGNPIEETDGTVGARGDTKTYDQECTRTKRIVQATNKITLKRLNRYGHVMVRYDEDNHTEGNVEDGCETETNWKDVDQRDMQNTGLKVGE